MKTSWPNHSPTNNKKMNSSTLDTIAAMRRQEVGAYVLHDFLAKNTSQSCDNDNSMVDVDADCRSKMVAWCFSIIDFCDFDRETVHYAVNYVDRFCMADEQIIHDRSMYQLAFMSALYTAVKLHEPTVISPATFSQLTHGVYTTQDFEAMEVHMLSALQWRVNPPTAMSFVHQFLKLLPATVREPVATLCQIQTELAVADYAFCTVVPSVTAFCSLMNAVESLNSFDVKSFLQLRHRLGEVLQIENMDAVNNNTGEISARLYQAVESDPAVNEAVAILRATAPAEEPKESRRSSIYESPCSTAVAVSI